MPFHHVTAGLLYKGNYLNRSLSAGSDSEQLANISVEELDGKDSPAGRLSSPGRPRGHPEAMVGRLRAWPWWPRWALVQWRSSGLLLPE